MNRPYIVVAMLIVAKASRSEDDEIPGVYRVDVKADCSSPATAALDAFHENIAVGCLDDFTFAVFDLNSGEEVIEDPDTDAYSMTHEAIFQGLVKPSFGSEVPQSLFDEVALQ